MWLQRLNGFVLTNAAMQCHVPKLTDCNTTHAGNYLNMFCVDVSQSGDMEYVNPLLKQQLMCRGVDFAVAC